MTDQPKLAYPPPGAIQIVTSDGHVEMDQAVALDPEFDLGQFLRLILHHAKQPPSGPANKQVPA